MFTGIIETLAKLEKIENENTNVHFTFSSAITHELKIDQSVAHNGVCLTVVKIEGDNYTVTAIDETLRRTNLRLLTVGDLVNLERCMPANGRFDGHIVQGHVDGTATVKVVRRLGQFADIEFAAQPELLRQMVVKGSVAVDGISLTVAAMSTGSFSVAVIPQTLGRTTLGKARIGDYVNIETDIIVKVVKKHLEDILPQDRPLTVERLRQLGF